MEQSKDTAKLKGTGESKDMVNHPSHYVGNIEVIDYLEEKLTPEEFIGFNIGNVIKYISRWRKKAGVQDLNKAKWYLDKVIDYINKNNININTNESWARMLP